MNLRTKATAYGIAGLALAGVIIFSGGVLGAFPVFSPVFNPGSPAVLSILLTDPPSVPAGVTAVYVTYTGLAVHNVAGLGDSGGWLTIEANGTLDTLSLVNLSKTISTSSVPSGEYNLVSIQVSSMSIAYQGKNYSATVSSDKLVIPIVGGLKLDASTPGAALVDLQPTVLNLGDQSRPQFVVANGARALQVPQDEVHSETRKIGNETSLVAKQWYHEFVSEHSTQLTISSVSLSAGALTLTVSNPSSDDAKIQTLIITPAKSGEGVSEALGSLSNSAVFSTKPDGSLQPLSPNAGTGEEGGGRALVEGSGYQLMAGSSVSFSYQGTITTMAGSGIKSGSSYQVIVVGEQVLAVVTVTAH